MPAYRPRRSGLERAQTFASLTFSAPYALFLVVVFGAPLAAILITSLQGGAFGHAYYDLASNKLFLQALANTLTISAWVALFSTLFGYIVARHLASLDVRRRSLFMILVLLPFWTSILVKSFAFMIILGNNGIINNMLAFFFGADAKLPLLFNRVGVVVGLVHWLTPFAVFPILISQLALDRNQFEAAKIMGAGPVSIFLRVELPQSLPGIAASFVMCVVLSMGSFVTPALLGGRKDLMLANVIDIYTREILDWQTASAIAVVLIVIVGMLTFASSKVGGQNLTVKT